MAKDYEKYQTERPGSIIDNCKTVEEVKKLLEPYSDVIISLGYASVYLDGTFNVGDLIFIGNCMIKIKSLGE